ncbi:MAG: hypothetical protein M1826_005031 [Phylliscum demangeonii]|nr:MAG: hypothetical protein M1826_005031 [Phylliscum demangeonii]
MNGSASQQRQQPGPPLPPAHHYPHYHHSADLREFQDDGLGGTGLQQGLRTFDAFPKTKTSYTTRHSGGGQWTVALAALCGWLTFSELRRWQRPHETREFRVEKGVGHTMQLNVDVVVAMRCADLHVNVQDAAGDLILAGQALAKEGTTWARWRRDGSLHALADEASSHHHHHDDDGDHDADDAELVEAVLGLTAADQRRGKPTFAKTPKLARGEPDAGACRIFGSIELNRVQGDFHITARGHGYMEFGQHLDHGAFNFSHIVNELSFGPRYPSLHNPLDATVATTAAHFYKFQYFLSIVPTVYRADRRGRRRPLRIATNQYAVTEQSRLVGERSAIPGVFFKFDVEPIVLLIRLRRLAVLPLLLRLVNVLAGVLVAGGWCLQLLAMLARGAEQDDGIVGGASASRRRGAAGWWWWWPTRRWWGRTTNGAGPAPNAWVQHGAAALHGGGGRGGGGGGGGGPPPGSMMMHRD